MADEESDFLLELLSYSCPLTGKKRVAGQDLPQETQHAKQLAGTFARLCLVLVCF